VIHASERGFEIFLEILNHPELFVVVGVNIDTVGLLAAVAKTLFIWMGRGNGSLAGPADPALFSHPCRRCALAAHRRIVSEESEERLFYGAILEHGASNDHSSAAAEHSDRVSRRKGSSEGNRILLQISIDALELVLSHQLQDRVVGEVLPDPAYRSAHFDNLSLVYLICSYFVVFIDRIEVWGVYLDRGVVDRFGNLFREARSVGILLLRRSPWRLLGLWMPPNHEGSKDEKAENHKCQEGFH
jgi:hypothetical protein